MRRALPLILPAAGCLTAAATFFAPTPAHAQACQETNTVSVVYDSSPDPFQCTDNDKLYTDFERSSTGFRETDLVNFEESADLHTYDVTALGSSITENGFSSNQIQILDPEKNFTRVFTDFTGGENANVSLQLEVLNSDSPLFGTVYNLAARESVFFDRTDNVTLLGVLNEYEASTGFDATLRGFRNNFFQTPDPVPQAPGPLPILGGGVAFGFSRKLRNRIRKATTA